MRFSAAISLVALMMSGASAFAPQPAATASRSATTTTTSSSTSLDVIRSKNFKRAKLNPNPQVDPSEVVKAGVSVVACSC